jgi:hypothetical protein
MTWRWPWQQPPKVGDMLELTQLAPQPEPEVADRKRWPKPGSPPWVDRYQLTLDHIEAAMAASPSSDTRVQLAWVELTAAIHEDFQRGKAARNG